MAHIVTILAFLLLGGTALGIILFMLADYADKIGAALGLRNRSTVLPPLRNPRIRAQVRPVLVRHEIRLRAAA